MNTLIKPVFFSKNILEKYSDGFYLQGKIHFNVEQQIVVFSNETFLKLVNNNKVENSGILVLSYKGFWSF